MLIYKDDTNWRPSSRMGKARFDAALDVDPKADVTKKNKLDTINEINTIAKGMFAGAVAMGLGK
ncbi:MAG: hypothetical protein K5656_09825 [Lachnospiraceae bacterium]|nr:hypothetical protein [Lachnospiraceae bacterium]